MKHFNTLTLFAVCLILASCHTAKLNYTPDDTIPIFSESPLIQYKISTKTMTYRLGFMKNKSKRFKHIRKIESLNKLALDRFNKKTLTLKSYEGVCQLSCISLQFVTWLAIIESSQGAQVDRKVSFADFKSSKAVTLPDNQMEQLIAKSNFESEDGIAEFLKEVAALLEKILNSPNKRSQPN